METIRFAYPYFPASFEIPRDWWEISGIWEFRPVTDSYHSADGHSIIPLLGLMPMVRNKSAQNDFLGFDRNKMIDVLTGLALGENLPPIEICEIPNEPETKWTTRNPFRYRILDGFHRYHASIAVGFPSIPVCIRDVH